MDCPSADWTGVLLAGGQSKRMGSDKRHMKVSVLRSQSLLEHSSQLLAQLCQFKVVSVASAQEPNLPDGFCAVADRHPGKGPLFAISDCLQEIKTPFALIIPVDMPCLRTEHLKDLMLSFEQGNRASAACFVLNREQRPTFPLLATQEFAASLAAEVAAGQVRLFQGLRAAGAKEVEPQWQLDDSCGPDPFLNLNRPIDVETLEADTQQDRP
jgi:molybdopterin-guanine dinucleotide biosynthesis protein A